MDTKRKCHSQIAICGGHLKQYFPMHLENSLGDVHDAALLGKAFHSLIALGRKLNSKQSLGGMAPTPQGIVGRWRHHLVLRFARTSVFVHPALLLVVPHNLEKAKQKQGHVASPTLVCAAKC